MDSLQSGHVGSYSVPITVVPELRSGVGPAPVTLDVKLLRSLSCIYPGRMGKLRHRKAKGAEVAWQHLLGTRGASPH